MNRWQAGARIIAAVWGLCSTSCGRVAAFSIAVFESSYSRVRPGG